MDKFIIVFMNEETAEVTCEFTTQKDSLVKFCNHRKSLLEQQLKGPEVVFAVNENAIQCFRKVGA